MTPLPPGDSLGQVQQDILQRGGVGNRLARIALGNPPVGFAERDAFFPHQLVGAFGGVDAVVVDSVAALVPRAEIEGEMGDSFVGIQARLMSQALRKLTAAVHRQSAAVLFINQIRMKIGVSFGSPETTTGGNALKFYASVRLDIRRIATLKEDGTASGNRTRVKVVKNKIAPPFKEAEFDIMYGTGISREGDLVDLGVECNIVEKSGSWFSYGEDRIGQGRENAKQYLVEHPEIAADIEARVLEHYGLKPAGKPSEGA